MRIAPLLTILALMATSAASASDPIQFTTVTWKPAPPSLPAGSQVAVLEGDPKASGLFTMRVKVPAGSKIQPHWHPRAERVTVIWGEARLGFGDKFDAKKTKSFPAGSYYVTPAETHHFLYFPRTTVLQMTNEGPWELNYLK